jgi:hypothetical protein
MRSPPCWGLVGVLQIVGAASGGTDPLQPLARFAARSELAGAADAPQFTAVHSVAELDAALRLGGSAGDARFLCRLVRLLQGEWNASPSPIRRCSVASPAHCCCEPT